MTDIINHYPLRLKFKQTSDVLANHSSLSAFTLSGGVKSNFWERISQEDGVHMACVNEAPLSGGALLDPSSLGPNTIPHISSSCPA